ncbi:MAG: hypothetical protein ACLSA6_06230 [Holdemania massiliensis]
MIVLQQADVYVPDFAGRQDILIAGGQIVKMAEHLIAGKRRLLTLVENCGSGFD